VQEPVRPEPIAFDGLLVVVGGGQVDPAVMAELAAAGAEFVGADAGGDVIAAAGLTPAAIIGDLDSLSDPAEWESGTRLIRISEQETIDFEKVLYSTAAPVTVALGMTGDRFDHTLAALDAVTRQSAGRHIILVDAHDLALTLTGPFSFEVEAGERVSVHPLAPVTFAYSEGLRYPLNGLHLAPGVRTGTSNEAPAGPFTIVPQETEHRPWLLILGRRYLIPLVERLLTA
jgi:thiamine pyrophosphokinase